MSEQYLYEQYNSSQKHLSTVAILFLDMRRFFLDSSTYTLWVPSNAYKVLDVITNRHR